MSKNLLLHYTNNAGALSVLLVVTQQLLVILANYNIPFIALWKALKLNIRLHDPLLKNLQAKKWTWLRGYIFFPSVRKSILFYSINVCFILFCWKGGPLPTDRPPPPPPPPAYGPEYDCLFLAKWKMRWSLHMLLPIPTGWCKNHTVWQERFNILFRGL